ncbi:MAG: hypothetical protein QOG54_613 [Actinomycetota bacterium]|jgi:hypothetical protein|nr:hypothetical protein [Actinomycetota bacterium]
MPDTMIEGAQAPLEHIERELTELSAHIHAATCRFLVLIAEFDRRRGWAEWDCRSCAHWLSWKCGLSLTAAREHVRVAKALERLPLIRDAFACGELSFSKVRAIVRVASPEMQDTLLHLARYSTAYQLERLSRAYRKVQNAEELRRTNVRRARRYVNFRQDDDGSFLLTARLSPEDGAVVLAALSKARDAAPTPFQVESEIDAANDHVERDRDSDEGNDSAESFPEVAAARDADALVLMASGFLSFEADGAPATNHHELIVHVDLAAIAGDRCELEDGTAIAPETARRLGCEAAIRSVIESEGEVLNVGRRMRGPTRAMRKGMEARDRGCRFPGCDQIRHVQPHHVHHWTRGGETRLSNLVSLCRFHHWLVHEGGYTLTMRNGEPEFRDRSGDLVVPVPPPLALTSPISTRNTEAGLHIDPEACSSRWEGDRMPYEECVDALVRDDPLFSMGDSAGAGSQLVDGIGYGIGPEDPLG